MAILCDGEETLRHSCLRLGHARESLTLSKEGEDENHKRKGRKNIHKGSQLTEEERGSISGLEEKNMDQQREE